jgi:hypothetical protein
MKNSFSVLPDHHNNLEFPAIYSNKINNNQSSQQHSFKNSQSLYQKNTKPITVNLADTQYPVIEEVCEDLGWRMDFATYGGLYANQCKWDIKWTDHAVTS